jgi:hypothetical protein
LLAIVLALCSYVERGCGRIDMRREFNELFFGRPRMV